MKVKLTFHLPCNQLAFFDMFAHLSINTICTKQCIMYILYTLFMLSLKQPTVIFSLLFHFECYSLWMLLMCLCMMPFVSKGQQDTITLRLTENKWPEKQLAGLFRKLFRETYIFGVFFLLFMDLPFSPHVAYIERAKIEKQVRVWSLLLFEPIVCFHWFLVFLFNVNYTIYIVRYMSFLPWRLESPYFWCGDYMPCMTNSSTAVGKKQ